MPKKPPASGRIKKGEARNKLGLSAKVRNRRALAPAMASMTPDTLSQLLCLMLGPGPIQQLIEVCDDPNTTKFEKLTAKCAFEAYDRGDYKCWQIFAEYMYGKPTAKLEVSGKDGGPIQTQTYAEMVAELKTLEKRRREMERLGSDAAGE